MTKTRGFSYAVVLAAAFVLWTPVALAGTQGFSALLGLASIPAAFFAPLKKTNRIVLAITILALWATLSSFWSAENSTVLDGTFSQGNFSIGAAAIRVLLTVLAGVLVLSASLRIGPSPSRMTIYVVLACLGIHAGWTLAMAFAPDWILSLYAPYSDVQKEAPQNMLRSTNAFLLGLPILIGASCTLTESRRRWALGGLLILSALAFLLIGSDVAFLGIVLIIIALGIVLVFPVKGFRILFASIAALIVAAPALLGVGGALVSDAGLPLPTSVQSRVWAWELTNEKIFERPITGHGIEASKEWRETFGDRPKLLDEMIERTGIDDGRWTHYRILPGHPHNMGMQLWAETGLIGVVLAILSLLAIGWKLPEPASLPSGVRFAAAGLTGASFALFSLSYSVWNEAFWATICLAAAGIILMARRLPSS